MTEFHANLVDGDWVAGSDAGENVNPSNTDEVVGRYARGSKADAERAIAAAKVAFPAWSRSGKLRRGPGEAGMVMVNLPTAGVDYHVPFGGRKGSSYGPREQGRYAVEFYTTVKTTYTAPG